MIRDNADASIVHVKLVRGAPLSGRILFWSDDATGVTSLWNPISVGIDEDGESASLYLPENNLIAGGEPGAGKSVFLVVLLNIILRDPSVKLFIFDPVGSASPVRKGGVERPCVVTPISDGRLVYWGCAD